MIWYVAFVALVNLALGYGLAVFFSRKRGDIALVGGSAERGDAAEF
jgi:hypothetical protein